MRHTNFVGPQTDRFAQTFSQKNTKQRAFAKPSGFAVATTPASNNRLSSIQEQTWHCESNSQRSDDEES